MSFIKSNPAVVSAPFLVPSYFWTTMFHKIFSCYFCMQASGKDVLQYLHTIFSFFVPLSPLHGCKESHTNILRYSSAVPYNMLG